jgi:hypothetical protein
MNATGIGAVTVRFPLPVAVVPAALRAVTVQVAVPWELVPTLMLLLVPTPEAVAPAPEQLTDALVALAVAQLKVEAVLAGTEVGLNDAPVTEGAATTWKVLEPVAEAPVALYAVTEQVPVPVPDVPTMAPE